MTWSQTDIDKLRSAIADGGILQSMTLGDQTFTFRSVADMLKLLATMERTVSGGSGTRYAATRKGA